MYICKHVYDMMYIYISITHILDNSSTCAAVSALIFFADEYTCNIHIHAYLCICINANMYMI